MSWWEGLESIAGVSIEKDKDLSKSSTMKLKAHGDLITIRSLEGLKALLPVLSQRGIAPIPLGLGANQILPEHSLRPYLKLALPFDKSLLEKSSDSYLLPASVTLNLLTQHALKFGNKGWEVFTGIPATLGGAVFMNAGTALGEIGELVEKVWLVGADGKEREVLIGPGSFSYRKNHFTQRGDVIVAVLLAHKGLDPSIPKKIQDYLDYRTRTQPLQARTCGCMFKNATSQSMTCRAGHYIDIMGLKGLTIGKVRIGHKHANFMENLGEARHEDVMQAVKVVLDELYLQYGVRFEPEVEF